jgi:hypothetical protein
MKLDRMPVGATSQQILKLVDWPPIHVVLQQSGIPDDTSPDDNRNQNARACHAKSFNRYDLTIKSVI